MTWDSLAFRQAVSKSVLIDLNGLPSRFTETHPLVVDFWNRTRASGTRLIGRVSVGSPLGIGGHNGQDDLGGTLYPYLLKQSLAIRAFSVDIKSRRKQYGAISDDFLYNLHTKSSSWYQLPFVLNKVESIGRTAPTLLVGELQIVCFSLTFPHFLNEERPKPEHLLATLARAAGK